MKKIFSLLFFFSLVTCILAQTITVSLDTIYIKGPNKANDDDFSDLEHGFTFKNINAASDSFRWVRTLNNLPSNEWESAVCDINLCYPSDVDSADFELVKGDSGIFYPHFYPGKGIGKAEMVIDIFNLNDRSQKVTIVVYAEAWDAYNSVASLSPNKSGLLIYPNPVNTGGTVSIGGEKPATVCVKNLEGKIIHTGQINSQNRTFTTATLSKGIYFIELQEKNQIKTGKLIIN